MKVSGVSVFLRKHEKKNEVKSGPPSRPRSGTRFSKVPPEIKYSNRNIKNKSAGPG